MSGPDEPIPQRIGDAERDQAAEFLREHLAQGRLDPMEFDERIGKALTAKTASELDPLFIDLPDPKPKPPISQQPAAASPAIANEPPTAAVAARPAAAMPERKIHPALAAVGAFAWPAAIVICFATHWQFWWIMMIPLFFPWWLGRGPDHRQRGRRGYR